MQIGHTRPIEVIVAIVLLVVAIRVALPLPSTVYTNIWIKAVFTVLLGAPAVLLLLARGLRARKRALVGVLGTFMYSGILGVVLEPARFAGAAAWLGLGAITGYLYLVTAREMAKEAEWTPDGSSPSPPPAEE
jgi:hypothetical protein